MTNPPKKRVKNAVEEGKHIYDYLKCYIESGDM